MIFFCIKNIPNRCAAGMRQQSLQILKLPEPLAREASAVFHWMEPPRRAIPCRSEGGVRYSGTLIFKEASMSQPYGTVRLHNRRERCPSLSLSGRGTRCVGCLCRSPQWPFGLSASWHTPIVSGTASATYLSHFFAPWILAVGISLGHCPLFSAVGGGSLRCPSHN